MITLNTSEWALVLSITSPIVQGIVLYLGSKKNNERSDEFKKVAQEQNSLKDLNIALDTEVKRLREEVDKQYAYIQDLQEWNRDMDLALRTANIPVPNPPWSKRFSGPYRG